MTHWGVTLSQQTPHPVIHDLSMYLHPQVTTTTTTTITPLQEKVEKELQTVLEASRAGKDAKEVAEKASEASKTAKEKVDKELQKVTLLLDVESDESAMDVAVSKKGGAGKLEAATGATDNITVDIMSGTPSNETTMVGTASEGKAVKPEIKPSMKLFKLVNVLQFLPTPQSVKTWKETKPEAELCLNMGNEGWYEKRHPMVYKSSVPNPD